jgi:hypothetical protein
MESEEALMRRVIASELVSLDGVVESPEKWHFPYFNDQMGETIGAAMAASRSPLYILTEHVTVLYDPFGLPDPRSDCCSYLFFGQVQNRRSANSSTLLLGV